MHRLSLIWLRSIISNRGSYNVLQFIFTSVFKSQFIAPSIVYLYDTVSYYTIYDHMDDRWSEVNCRRRFVESDVSRAGRW